MATKFRYEIIIYWSDEDQAFIAEVPELPGCAADGATYQEAIANAELAIRNGLKQHRNSVASIPDLEADCYMP